MDFVVETEVESECETPCGVPDELLLEVDAAKVVPVELVLRSTVEFKETQGDVLIRLEVDAVGVLVLASRVLFSLV